MWSRDIERTSHKLQTGIKEVARASLVLGAVMSAKGPYCKVDGRKKLVLMMNLAVGRM